MVTLTEQERMVLDEFIAENWVEFCKVAERYMDEGETEALSDKLKG